MSTKDERKEILKALDDEFRQDLALHLYSSVLLHRVDPHFPRRGWSAWPLAFDTTPIPPSNKLYVDTPFADDDFPHDIEVDYEKIIQQKKNWTKSNLFVKTAIQKVDPNSKKSPGRKKLNVDASCLDTDSLDSPQVQEESDEDEWQDANDSQDLVQSSAHSANLFDSLHGDDNTCEIYGDSTRPSFANYTENETVSNSKVVLLNELHALIERKIHAKATGESKDISISPESSSSLTKELALQLAAKVDTLVNNLAAMPKPYIGNSFEPKTWHNVLLASISNSPYESHNPQRTEALLKKFQSLFEDIKHNYEFESDNEELFDSENENSAILPVADDVEVANLGSKFKDPKGFDVRKYLKHLATANPKQYTRIYNSYFNKRHQRQTRQALLNKLVLDKLDVQGRYEDLIWSQERVKKKSPDSTTSNDVEKLKAKFLHQEPATLDCQSYLLGHHFEFKSPRKKRQVVPESSGNSGLQ